MGFKQREGRRRRRRREGTGCTAERCSTPSRGGGGGVQRGRQTLAEKPGPARGTVQEIWQFPASSRGVIPLLCFLPCHPPHLTPPPIVRRGIRLFGAAPPRVFTLRRFHPCGPRLVIPGLFSREKGLSFSGLDPSFVSSDTKGTPSHLPYARLLLTWGLALRPQVAGCP